MKCLCERRVGPRALWLTWLVNVNSGVIWMQRGHTMARWGMLQPLSSLWAARWRKNQSEASRKLGCRTQFGKNCPVSPQSDWHTREAFLPYTPWCYPSNPRALYAPVRSQMPAVIEEATSQSAAKWLPTAACQQEILNAVVCLPATRPPRCSLCCTCLLQRWRPHALARRHA